MISGVGTLSFSPQTIDGEGLVATGPGVSSTDIFTVIRILMPVALVTYVSKPKISVTPEEVANQRFVE